MKVPCAMFSILFVVINGNHTRARILRFGAVFRWETGGIAVKQSVRDFKGFSSEKQIRGGVKM